MNGTDAILQRGKKLKVGQMEKVRYDKCARISKSKQCRELWFEQCFKERLSA